MNDIPHMQGFPVDLEFTLKEAWEKTLKSRTCRS